MSKMRCFENSCGIRYIVTDLEELFPIMENFYYRFTLPYTPNKEGKFTFEVKGNYIKVIWNNFPILTEKFKEIPRPVKQEAVEDFMCFVDKYKEINNA